MDRMDPDHQLAHVGGEARSRSATSTRSPPMMLGRAKQAHHGIEDVEVKDLDAELARGYAGLPGPDARLARRAARASPARCCWSGGVGVLSVMLISFSDRRYEIGLRKAMGASDGEILVQFLLEALVLAALGASFGTLAGSAPLQGPLRQVPLRPRGQPRWASSSPGASRSCSRSPSASTRRSARRASRRWRRCGRVRVSLFRRPREDGTASKRREGPEKRDLTPGIFQGFSVTGVRRHPEALADAGTLAIRNPHRATARTTPAASGPR